MKRFVLGAVATAVVLVSGWQTSAAPPPTRSGTIVGGWFAGAGGPSQNECAWLPECLVWKTSGCRADVAGKVPGLHASIVNVRRLGSRTQWWRFDVRPDPPVAGAPSVVWGGLTLEAWSRDCRKLRLVGEDVWEGMVRDVDTRTVWRMPPATEWLTATSADNTTVRWTLRRTSRP